MKKVISWLVALFALTGVALAQCTLAPNYQSNSNISPYGFTAMAGQVLTPNIKQSGCPSFTITNISTSGGVISATGTGTTIPVGKWAVIITPEVYPYRQLSNTVFQVASSSSTSFTSQVLPGLINNGSAAVSMTAIQVSLINYSVANTIGSITGTLSCTTNCGSAVTLTVGSTPTNGSCSYVGSGPVFTGVTSTQKLTITATAVDSGSTTTIPVSVCSDTVKVQIPGDLYYQNYVGQQRHLASFVWGTTNQQVTWGATGPCTLSNTTGSRDVVVTTTGTGYCNVTATSVADGTKNQTATVYIPSALPSYGDTTPVLTQSLPCALDSNLTGNDFEVGPGKTYTSIGAVPWTNSSMMTPGSTVRIYNTAAGTGQTSYAEGWVVPFAGTAGQTLHICGVPNTAGYPPIIEAASAVYPAGTSGFAAGFGQINFQLGGCNGYYPVTPCVQFVLLAGLQWQNAVGPNTWSITGGGSGTWGSGADAINDRQGSFITIDSNYINNSEQGIGTYNNENNGWAGLSQMIDVSRPVCIQCGGRGGDATSHPAYLQSYGMFYHEFIIGDAPATDAGSCIKDRNIGSIIMGGRCGQGYARYLDRAEDQDSAGWVDVGQYAFDGLPAAGDMWGVNGVTQFQYQLYTDVVAYNIFDDTTVSSGTPFHMLADHDDNNGSYGMNAFYGHFWFFFNTFYGEGQLFDQANSFGDNYFLAATAHSYNNIFWPVAPTSVMYNSYAITNMDIKNDLWETGGISTAVPIIGEHYNDSSSTGLFGWGGDTSPNNYWYDRPLQNHISGQGSLVFTTTQPFTTGTWALPGGSAAIGAAAALTGEAALFPPRWNAISSTGVLTARTTATDLGAVGSGGAPPPTNSLFFGGKVKFSGNVKAQ